MSIINGKQRHINCLSEEWKLHLGDEAKKKLDQLKNSITTAFEKCVEGIEDLNLHVGDESKKKLDQENSITAFEKYVEEIKDSKLHLGDEGKKKLDQLENSITAFKKYVEEVKDLKKQDGEKPTVIYLVFILLGIIVGIILVPNLIPSDSSPQGKHSFRSVEEFIDIMDDVHTNFSSQPEFYWKTLKNVGRNHLKLVHDTNSKKKSPLLFHLVTYNSCEETLECLLQMLGMAYTSKNYSIINSKGYQGPDARRTLDQKIKSSLSSSQKLLIVKDVDKLKFETAQLFMSYGDDYSDVATYPQSVIFLSTVLPYSYDSTKSRHDEEEKVSNYYKEIVWKGSNVNNVAALWTRVASTLVLVNPEKTSPCSNHG